MLINILGLNCSDEITSPALNFKKTAKNFDRAVRVNDSTIVKAEFDSGIITNNSSFIYKWETDFGTVKGSGESAIFYAPNENGSANIKVTMIGQNADSIDQAYEILVYKQFIILKADDFTFDAYYVITPRWQTFLNYVMDNNLRAGLGLVGKSLTEGNVIYYKYLKEINNTGYFEIWNHGYSHEVNSKDENGNTYHEYWNTSFEYQKGNLVRTQYLAEDKLGIQLKTIGTPGNAYDENTLKAIDEIPELSIWIFGNYKSSKFIISERSDVEFPALNPDYNKFILNYDPHKEYLVLQIHPNSWTEDRFSQFNNIVQFLKQQKVSFVTPYQYYEYNRFN